MYVDTFVEYEKAIEEMDVMKAKGKGEHGNDLPLPVYYALGLAGEAGEVVDKIKKVYRDSGGDYTPEIKAAIILELGDVLWYLARLAGWLGVSLGVVALRNVTKLMGRKQRGTTRGSGDNR